MALYFPSVHPLKTWRTVSYEARWGIIPLFLAHTSHLLGGTCGLHTVKP